MKTIITTVLFKSLTLLYKVLISILITINVYAHNKIINNGYPIDCSFSIKHNLAEIESVSTIATHNQYKDGIISCHLFVTNEKENKCSNTCYRSSLYNYYTENYTTNPWNNFFETIKTSIKKDRAPLSWISSFATVLNHTPSDNYKSTKSSGYTAIDVEKEENIIKIKYNWKLEQNPSIDRVKIYNLNNTKHILIQQIIYDTKDYFNLEMDTGLPDYQSTRYYNNSVVG